MKNLLLGEAILSEKEHELSNCLLSVAEATILFFTFARRWTVFCKDDCGNRVSNLNRDGSFTGMFIKQKVNVSSLLIFFHLSSVLLEQVCNFAVPFFSCTKPRCDVCEPTTLASWSQKVWFASLNFWPGFQQLLATFSFLSLPRIKF